MSKTLVAAAALATILSGASAIAQPGPQGPVTRDQFIALAKQRFAQVDANSDGTVTKEEMTALMAARMGNSPKPEMVDRMFSWMDTNGDGKATAAEAEAAAAARFTEMDTDKNGTLSIEEQAAARQSMRRQ